MTIKVGMLGTLMSFVIDGGGLIWFFLGGRVLLGRDGDWFLKLREDGVMGCGEGRYDHGREWMEFDYGRRGATLFPTADAG
jgi:hypothetical protein